MLYGGVGGFGCASGSVRRRRARSGVDARGFFERLLDVSNEPSGFLVTRTRRKMGVRSVIAPTHGAIASSRSRCRTRALRLRVGDGFANACVFHTMPPARATAASSSSVFVPLRSPFGRFLSRRGRALSSLASVVAASVQRAPSGHPPLANGPFFTAMSTNEVNMTSLDPPTPIEGARAVDASPPRRRVRRSRRMRLSSRRGRDGLGLANGILCT